MRTTCPQSMYSDAAGTDKLPLKYPIQKREWRAPELLFRSSGKIYPGRHCEGSY